MRRLIPTRSQWQKWSLPSKYGLIGLFIGIVSLLLTILLAIPYKSIFPEDNDVSEHVVDLSRFRQKLDLKNTAFLGLHDAPLEMIMFVDFESPYTARVVPTVQSLVSDYTGLLKVYIKHNPLDFHSNGKKAALAVIAASMQGRFLDYFAKVSMYPRNLREDDLFRYASELNLNLSRFRHDYMSENATELLNQDKKEAKQLGITGAPMFLLEDYDIPGAYPYSKFRDNIVMQLTQTLKNKGPL